MTPTKAEALAKLAELMSPQQHGHVAEAQLKHMPLNAEKSETRLPECCEVREMICMPMNAGRFTGLEEAGLPEQHGLVQLGGPPLRQWWPSWQQSTASLGSLSPPSKLPLLLPQDLPVQVMSTSSTTTPTAITHGCCDQRHEERKLNAGGCQGRHSA